MINNKIKYTIVGTVLVSTLFIGGIRVVKNATPSPDIKYIEETNTLNKADVINELKEINMINFMQTSLSSTRSIQGTWFKNDVTVEFKAIGYYSIDLDTISNNSVVIDGNKTILFINKPLIHIEFNENETIVESEDKFYKLGDVKLSLEQYELLKKSVRESMVDTLNQDEYINQAMKSAEQRLNSILKLTNNIDVEVRWIG